MPVYATSVIFGVFAVLAFFTGIYRLDNTFFPTLSMHHTKGNKKGTGNSLAGAPNKWVVPGRYKKAGKYLLWIFVMSQ